MTTEETTGRRRCAGADDLPVEPFRALRVAYGMLLGEQDFGVLMGNPRGKQMVHASWLHGSGVVWGYEVRLEGKTGLRVTPGLAVDGLGRELSLDVSQCVDAGEWLSGRGDDQNGTAYLIAMFEGCLSRPVPALADPCDISRKQTDYSRVVEGTRIELRKSGCPERRPPYHRLRVLLGLENACKGDEEVEAARRAIVSMSPHERPPELLRCFRVFAAQDVLALKPAKEEGGACPSHFPSAEESACLSHFPSAEESAPVLLAKLTVDGGRIRVDQSVRRTLIPTGTLQELICGLAPALLNSETERDEGGPRVVRDSLRWTETDGHITFTFNVEGRVARGSLQVGPSDTRPIVVTSLGNHGWVDEDISTVDYAHDTVTVMMRRMRRPLPDLVRVLIRGTGATPVMGVNGVPLAGFVDGPSGGRSDGHDAVLTVTAEEEAGE